MIDAKILDAISFTLEEENKKTSCTKPIKDEIHVSDCLFFEKYADLEHGGAFMPEHSWEAVVAAENLDCDRFVLVDQDEEIANQLRFVYDHPEFEVLEGKAHSVLSGVAPVSFGHFDFYGYFNSSETRTEELIKSLMSEDVARSCWAFTHTGGAYRGHAFESAYRHLYEDLFEYAIDVGKEVEFLNSWDSFRIVRKKKGANTALKPSGFVTLLIAWCFVIHTNYEAQVTLLDEDPYRGNQLGMVHSVVAVDRNLPFDYDLFMQSVTTLQGKKQPMAKSKKAASKKTITTMTPKDRAALGTKVVRAIGNGWSDARILGQWPQLSKGSLSAYKANHTRGTYSD